MGIDPSRVWFQSFSLDDLLYWQKTEPQFATHAVLLDERVETAAGYAAAVAGMQVLANQGVKILGPAFPYLLKVDPATKAIVPSDYAIAAREAGIELITWALERSGPLAFVAEEMDCFYTTISSVIKCDG